MAPLRLPGPIGALLKIATLALALALLVVTPAIADYVGGLDPNGDNYLSLRSGPGGRYPEIMRLGPDTPVTVIGGDGVWRRIRLNDGTVGWAHGDYILGGEANDAGPQRPPAAEAGPDDRQTADAASSDWTRYENARFGFAIDVPPGFAMAPPPTNDDGRTLTSPDQRATIRVYGAHNIDSLDLEGLQAQFRERLSDVAITYERRLPRGFVLSGLRAGAVIYQRVMLSGDGSIYTVLDATYPAAGKRQFDAPVARMSTSLRPGQSDNGAPGPAVAEGDQTPPPEADAQKPDTKPGATAADLELERLKVQAEIERLKLDQLKLAQQGQPAGTAAETPKTDDGAAPPLGQKRVALVIGNGAYQGVTALPTPRHDAKRMGEQLRRLGFEVAVGTDLTRAAMTGELAAFYNNAKGADVALFYFSGHGVQLNGRNYLLPIDASFADANAALDVEGRAIDLQKFLNAAGGAAITLAFIDACRDNPILEESLAKTLYKGIGGPTKGLAVVRREDVSKGQFVGFAAEEGKTAQTGAGDTSVYTVALLKYLAQPGLDVSVLHRRVRKDVEQETHGEQSPRAVDDLREELVLLPASK